MSTYELEKQDMSRSEIKRIPVKYLENLGKVSEPREVPPCEPFSGSAPFPVDEYADLFFEEDEADA